MQVNAEFPMKTLLFLLLATTLHAAPPNILWIIGDDLGVELGCYGNPDATTPNSDRLAEQGMRFTNAFSTAPVCSASRSAFITGMYQNGIACEDHRTMLMKPLPDGVQPVTQRLKQAGYFTVSVKGLGGNGKTDFNFSGKDFFDSTKSTDLKNAISSGKPFFAHINIFEPHRQFTKLPKGTKGADPDKVSLPPQYPDHPLARKDWAAYLDAVQVFDIKVGKILSWLDEQGVSENTVVFLFGDHGRPHVRDKQWLSDAGLRVPLIIRWPGKAKPNTSDDRLVSLIDVTAETLLTAGIPIPENMDGRPFIGPDTTKREYTFAARDRCGEAFDRIRSVHDGRFNYIRNLYPELPYWQTSRYKSLGYPVLDLMKELHDTGQLTDAQDAWFSNAKPAEELYDLNADPHELLNLANDPAHEKDLSRLQNALDAWLEETETSSLKADVAAEYDLALKGTQKSHDSRFTKDEWDKRSDEITRSLRERNFQPEEKER